MHDRSGVMVEGDFFETKSSRVYGELKRDITAGTYRPGEHLVRRGLVKKHGVSFSIVNEALARLSSDGLVETKEMFGTRVISLNEQTLKDEFALREAVERYVARVLAERATDEVLTGLLEDAKTLDRCINELGDDEGPGSLLHLDFHLKLARSTGFASLEETLKRTSMRALLTTRLRKNQWLPHPEDFHQQLVRALLKRDAAIADETMCGHLHYANEYEAKHREPAAIPEAAKA